MHMEKQQLQEMRSLSFAEIKADQLNLTENRMVLRVEGPFSPVFYNEHTKKRQFGSLFLTFEYYWISLSYLISNGEFIFMIIYYVFSM